MKTVGGITPNTFTYSALISALGKSGHWELAQMYFNELKIKAKTNHDVLPNTVTYAAVISGESNVPPPYMLSLH
jgi:pentatricopeptide repeat protein